MSDTIGSLVDKLATVNNKMFFNQEFLYAIRRMSKLEFVNRCLCLDDADKNISLEDLYDNLCKIVDLNLQRQSLILEHDKLLVEMVIDLIHNDKEAISKYVFDQHKTLKTEE